MNEGGGLAGTLRSKFGPLPVWGWLAAITVLLLGWYLWEQHKGGAAAAQQQPTAAQVGQPGVVVINQDQPEGEQPDETEPPVAPEHKPKAKKTTREITVERNETLGQLAQSRHWTPATLRAVEQMNVTQGKGKLTGKTKLKKGETIIRPLAGRRVG